MATKTTLKEIKFSLTYSPTYHINQNIYSILYLDQILSEICTRLHNLPSAASLIDHRYISHLPEVNKSSTEIRNYLKSYDSEFPLEFIKATVSQATFSYYTHEMKV